MIPERLKTWAPALGLAALAAFPLAVQNPYYIHLLVVIGIYAILIFGLDIVVGYTGEVSLGHAALFGIGAYATGILIAKAGLPPLAAAALAVIVTALFGALLALPALRVTGPYLAMVTLAFGTIVQILLNEMDFLTEGPRGLNVLKPAIWGHRLTAGEFYYVVLGVAALSLVVVTRVLSSHIGRAFAALRGSPIAADCMGVSVYRYKVLAFVISAVFAGLAGALYAFSEEYMAPNAFTPELSILFLLALNLGGKRSRVGAVIGATVIVVLPNLLSDLVLFRALTLGVALAVVAVVWQRLRNGTSTLRSVAPPLVVLAGFVVFAFTFKDIVEQRLTIFGLLILAVVYYLPEGIAGFLGSLVRARAEPAVQPAAAGAASVASIGTLGRSDPRPADGGGSLLQAQGVVMRFGGLAALNQVDLVVERGAVHGLIGPNGSGKSTMMNVLTGVYRPTEGRVRLGADDVTGAAPPDIARKGIARTFQNVQLFGEMTAEQNVLVGLHHTFRCSLLDVIFATRRHAAEEAAARAEARTLLAFVGQIVHADEEARNLPYGRQRLPEIARALALYPRLLLLDEPAAGLRPSDLPELRRMIEKIRDQGITVVLIEHHMDLVMAVCSKVSVLDFGQKIAEGAPAEVARNPRVVAAYLGATAEPAARPAATEVAHAAG